MSMIRLTVEEMNLLSIYHEGSKAQLMENMTAALPFMDEDMRPFAERTLQKTSTLRCRSWTRICGNWRNAPLRKSHL